MIVRPPYACCVKVKSTCPPACRAARRWRCPFGRKIAMGLDIPVSRDFRLPPLCMVGAVFSKRVPHARVPTGRAGSWMKVLRFPELKARGSEFACPSWVSNRRVADFLLEGPPKVVSRVWQVHTLCGWACILARCNLLALDRHVSNSGCPRHHGTPNLPTKIIPTKIA